MIKVDDLPDFIQSKICSYLYFSDQKSKDIEVINKTIKSYNQNIIDYLFVLFKGRHEILKYRILKYFVFKLGDKYSKCITDYEISNDLSRVMPTVKSLDIIEMNGLYKSIVNDLHIL